MIATGHRQTRLCPCGVLTMNFPIAVTIPEAVRASGLSRSSLYEALKKGDLSARKGRAANAYTLC